MGASGLIMRVAQNDPVQHAPKLRLRDGELGQEKYCPRCDDWWPADKEFFWETKGKLFYCCKACYHEMDKRAGRRGALGVS